MKKKPDLRTSVIDCARTRKRIQVGTDTPFQITEERNHYFYPKKERELDATKTVLKRTILISCLLAAGKIERRKKKARGILRGVDIPYGKPSRRLLNVTEAGTDELSFFLLVSTFQYPTLSFICKEIMPGARRVIKAFLSDGKYFFFLTMRSLPNVFRCLNVGLECDNY